MGKKRRFAKTMLFGVLFVASVFMFSGCGGSDANEPVRFGMVDWPEAIAKTNVASTVVSALGYETEISEVAVPLVFQGLEDGDLDVFVEAWFPTMQTNLDAVDQSEIQSVVTNLPEATFSVAVNREAYDGGVRSQADLNEFADRFEEGGQPVIYGIEPGNDGNQVVLDAISNGTYALSDWRLIESSVNGMLGEVGRRVDDGEWVAFVGWRPHWMNNEYDMVLLEDPEDVWGNPSRVETLANAEFFERYPDLETFFQQMVVTEDIQADLIDRVDNSGEEPEQVALSWLRENPEVTDEWLDGVTAADGTDGSEALRTYLEENTA